MKKYLTEEERKAARREYQKKWRAAHPDYQSEWKKKNPDYHTNYFKAWTEKKPDYMTEYHQVNKEKIYKQQAEYRQKNKEKITEYETKYRLTPKGRANNLLKAYRQTDKKYNRGECTLTADWIIQNIFSKPCHYCGKTDWHELGCDRIDNNLPHTPDNVVPCCDKCNKKRGTTPFDEYLKLVGKSNTD